ncbi:MAG: RNA polymerase sigma factor [Pseudomonadota bacterium]
MAEVPLRPPGKGLLETFTNELPNLRRFFKRRTGCAFTSDDLAQDAWIKLARNAERAEHAPGPYLWRIATSLVTDYQRALGRRQHFESNESPLSVADANGTPEDHVLATSELARLERTLSELPERRRAIFVAASVQGESTESLAKRFGVSRRMIQIEIQRAFQHCARAVDR